jgi:sugar lactone lactonase YvrE
MIESVSIANGISWTKDNKAMYFVDSPTKNIFKYDYDLDTGSISNRRVFFHVDDENGVPDGHVPDEEGCIWQAIHGIGKVIRISPEGKVLAEVKFPTRGVTCPGFVGEHLFVTSAEEEDPDKFPDSTKFQGSIFKVHVGVQGQTPHKFRLQA